MSENSNKLEEIPTILEKIIDSRFRYLHELRFENHRLARHILESEYDPEVEKLKKILENIA